MVRHEALHSDDENAEYGSEDPLEEELCGKDDPDGKADEEEPYEIQSDEELESNKEDPSEDESCEEFAESETKEQESKGDSGKGRQSRWAAEEGVNGQVASIAVKKRKTRWSRFESPDSANCSIIETFVDPEYQKLYMQLHEINQKLRKEVLVDDLPENARFPSPLLIYNDLGTRVNTREDKNHAELITQRQFIISELIKRKPTSETPSNKPVKLLVPAETGDVKRAQLQEVAMLQPKPVKLYKKLYIPEREYPGYNFVGLIIGPDGHKQKMMEKETGARISLRGKSTLGERKCQQYMDKKPEFWSNKDLHVLIEADSQQSLDAAEKMVAKLLVPAETGELKRAQLKEVALLQLKRTKRNKKKFPTKPRVSDPCDVCGDASHLTSGCPLIASTDGTSTTDHQVSFFAEVGSSGLSLFSRSPCPVPNSSHMAKPPTHALSAATTGSHSANFHEEVGNCRLSLLACSSSPVSASTWRANRPVQPSLSTAPWIVNPSTHALSVSGTGFHRVNFLVDVGNCNLPSSASSTHPVSTSTINPPVHAMPGSDGQHLKEIDEANLFVGGLPQSVNTTGLRRVNFLADVRNCSLPSSTSSTLPVSTSTVNPPVHALPRPDGQHLKEIDEANLFVGGLPRSLNTNKLIELFLPFGRISEAKVITDKSTNLSKGYGFVKYIDSISAAEAVARMNMYRIDGKVLTVRVAYPLSSTAKSSVEIGATTSSSSLPTYPGPAAVVQAKPVSLGAASARFMLHQPFTSLNKSNEPTILSAAGAVASMNRYMINGNLLTVREAHQPPSTAKSGLETGGPPSSSSLPTYPGPAAIDQGKPVLQEVAPARFMLPEPFTSFTKSNEPVTLSAAGAGACMNRYRIDGKVLTVREAHQPPSIAKSSLETGAPPSSSILPYPGPAAISQGKPVSPEAIPARFMLPTPFTSFTQSIGLPSHSQPVTFTAASQFYVPPLISGSITPSKELERFPGYLKSFESSSKHQTLFSHLKPPP